MNELLYWMRCKTILILKLTLLQKNVYGERFFRFMILEQNFFRLHFFLPETQIFPGIFAQGTDRK